LNNTANIFEDVKREICHESDITSIFSDLPKFHKEGSSYKALCPFHSEKTPSFTINIYNGVIKYHCFGCGENGDLFDFVDKYYNITDYKSQIKCLYELTGRPLPDGLIKSNSRRTELLNKHGLTEAAKQHLLDRGVNNFDLFGFDNGVYKILYRHNDGESIIEYRPEPNGKPKYLFEKGINKSWCFGLAEAVKSKDSTIYLTEGVFDCLNLQEIGLTAAAVLGTNLSTDTIKILNKHFNRVVLCFDNDQAGRKGSVKAIKSFYSQKAYAKEIFDFVYPMDWENEGYKDINEAVKAGEKISKRIITENTISGVELLAMRWYNGYSIPNKEGGFTFVEGYKDTRSSLEKSEHIENLFDLLDRWHEIDQTKFINYVKQYYNLDLSELRKIYVDSRLISELRTDLNSLNKEEHWDTSTIDKLKSIVENTDQKRIPGITLKKPSDLLRTTDSERIKSGVVDGISYAYGAISFIGARTSHGKTTFLLNEAALLSERVKVGFITLEETDDNILRKYCIAKYNLCGSEKDKRIPLTQYNINRINKEDLSSRLEKWDSNITISQPKNDITDVIRHMVYMNNTIGTRVFFLDYIQRVTVNDKAFASKAPYEKIKHINSKLLELAIKHNILIIAGAQMNRTVTSVEGIRRADVYREAGDIEQDGNVIINLFKEKTDDGRYILNYFVAKNRDGETGLEGSGEFDGAKLVLNLEHHEK